MDLLIQQNSRGIRYDGYDDDFIQCIFEDANVSGRNERYEFRCRPDLECCGRICCIPQENIIPLWLMILFILLGLFLLLALLSTMACFLRKIAKQNKSFDKEKKTKMDYRSYKQNESQEGLGTENLMRKEKKDLLGSIRGSGYRNPVYTTTTSTVKIRETFDRTIDDGNAYDKAGTDTDIAIGTGGEMTGRSELIKDSDGRKQLNTTGIRRNGYQVAESTSLPHTVSTTHSGPLSSEHYSTRETFEERCEENYIEEKKSMSEGKELLSN
ncbi:Uncharacterized protein ACO02O_04687 [Dirofilaria immitis]